MQGLAGLESLSMREPGLLAEIYLQIARRYVPIIGEVLWKFRDQTVGEYVNEAVRIADDCFEDRLDVSRAIGQRLRRVLGEKLALAAESSTYRTPVVMTANHHGVDYFAQSVQGTLILARTMQWLGARATDPVTVLACGTVPLNNLVYPRGLTLYGVNAISENDFPVKVPVFPDRMKRDIVSTVCGFDLDMVRRAEQKLERQKGEGVLDRGVSSTAQRILREDYIEAIGEPGFRYSEQATRINHRLWGRMFAVQEDAPALAYLEIEKVVGNVLLGDLERCDSLVCTVLFDTPVREMVIGRLNGLRVCWDTDALASRLRPQEAGGRDESAQGGTMFFWGLDGRGRRIPLMLFQAGSSEISLVGVDDHGNEIRVEFTPFALQRSLEEGVILPSLFLCYLIIALSRGMTCLGGYYQAQYLPQIQRAVSESLIESGRHGEASTVISMVQTDCYLSGMQTVMWRAGGDDLIPAGPVEIASRGGLSTSELKMIDEMKPAHAHLASLFETVPDAAPWAIGYPGWKQGLARDIGFKLKGNVVVLDS